MIHNILIVNHNIQNCGVYQYGKRVADICAKSKLFNFIYLEATSSDELFLTIKESNPSLIIYNYLPSTMPWITNSIFNDIRSLGIKQGNIIHNSEFGGFDFQLHQNPYYPNNSNNFALLRPLFEYIPKEVKRESNSIQIGTFGFGGQHKFIHEICRAVDEEFVDKEVELNLHITKGFYSSDDPFEEIKNDCQRIMSNSNIKLNITNNFLTNEGMLDFLFNNDLNIFFYENYSFYNGISSTIDYALSVQKPIAICKSNMFSHIMDCDPSICVEDSDLIEIINNGFKPLQQKYNSWSHKKFVDNIENIIKKII
jgi:hypothetical protein